MASRAMDTAIERAAQNGSCTVSIRNTNHMGILSFYALKAVKRNMIATVMCNTPPFVAAFGGAAPVIGTNPVCWALPGPEFPIVMDMAISPARGASVLRGSTE
ncbi:Malate/lactate dehydrogenase (fragment) [uncultured delta proteobacterium]|uniref:Malate/lactate dehydrogenase n=1 Tax=uncultured delta proteobacterium TaxID=34034 RepID=A0A212K4L0_9DELT